MNEKQEQTDWSAWFSTYGLVTAERILGWFKIHLAHDELIKVVKSPQSTYYQLLRVPMKNVFNGIIFQQAHDYQIYAQKLFVDYLMSGQEAKEEDSPGASIREDLERQRLILLEMGEGFRKQEEAHQTLIAESQAELMALSRDLDPQEIKNTLASYLVRAEENNINLRGYRRQFYDLILQVTELLKMLPDYHIDLEKEAENRRTLAFDALIGEE